ncbi:class IV lanthionine synthetase LanL [Kitasatospora cheerisanensis]|uniref:class IV lanthionine synthetase LanL n=1 Tax=Kitasatospora cheerisanensis TaxID=81942 RepID=UPI0005657898|nr:class IV lanthionine synthetase LanL [Kitasatospora cheerisanensis]
MTGPIAGRRPWSDDTWSYLHDPRMPAMEHGWKLHVSARPDSLDAVTAAVLPVLERHVCHAKWARDAATLRALNSGTVNAASVGKALTLYPAPEDLVPLARALVAALRGRPGPQIVSDRRLDPDAPVYYRYGPFTGDYRTGRSGRLESVMTGPDGRVFDGLAGTAYRCPPWAEDPFAPSARPTDSGFGGGRYRVTGGITRKPQGNLYRALDRATGASVVVKQARAYVAEDEHGADTRDRLRHEHAVLALLSDTPGVPRALDYFRHRDDEYLVMTSCGDRDLRREVHTHGPYRDAEFGPRGALPLGRELLRVLDGIHRRGVVVRDLKPDNVVLAADGRCRLVDFGTSAVHGTGPAGSTPGYSDPVVHPGVPARAADDYYGLGMTLSFAATGLDPVILDPDPAVNRERTLAALEFALPGPEHRRLRTLIAELTDLDPDARTAGAEHLRASDQRPSPAPGLIRPGPRLSPDLLAELTDLDPDARTAGAEHLRASDQRPSPAPGLIRSGPRLSPDLLAEVLDHTAAYCLAEARRIADPELAARAAVPTPIDLYGGSAGLGLELLHHLDRPGAPEAVAALAAWTARQSRTLSTGLYSGRTGVDLFLAAAGQPPAAALALPECGPDGGPPEADLIDGLAGIGLGHLLLAEFDERRLATATACHQLLTTGRARLTPTTAPRPGDAALAQGLAHGDAGVAYFLLAYARTTGDPTALAHAHRACERLAAAVPAIIDAANHPAATRRYGSWCRGLAGIGTVLARAADQLAEPAYRTLAEGSARTCLALAPRMPLVTRCCGLAGVGELMLELAPADEEFRNAAGTVATLLLTRAAGPPSRPVFPDAGLTRQSFPHATGTAGVLTFLRRLADPTDPRPSVLP